MDVCLIFLMLVQWLKEKEEVEGKIDKISEDYVNDNKPLYRKLQDIKDGKTVVW